MVDDVSAGDTSGHALRFASVAAIGGLLFGYDVSVTNGAVKALEAQFKIGNAALGLAVASGLLGAAVGATIAGRIADRSGRLALMKLAAVLFLACGLGTGLANSIWMFITFHVVGGLGIGVASVIGPAYIAEISPERIRGRLGSLQQLAIVSGIFLALAVSWLPFHLAGGPLGDWWLGLPAWRWTFLGEAVPAIAYGVLVFTIPESPRYLVASQRIPEAHRVLSMLLGEDDVDTTITRIAETLRREAPPSWRDLRKPTGGLYGVVWVGLGVAVFQQLVGITVIFFYSDALWEHVGFGAEWSFTIAVITAIVNVVITLVAIVLIDKVGRKPLLLFGSSGMAVMLATLTVVFGGAPILDGKPHLAGTSAVVALVAANLFVVAFGVSWGPVLWVLLGELFPNRIRAAAAGLAATGQWVTNAMVTGTFPALRHMLGGAYAFYMLAAVVSFLFVWRWVPETNGVSLEDMPADWPHEA
ncbi:sugar porter family MFS transporter [Mycobacterium shimoidei]|uniref:Sugar transporter [Tsukamurella paurometabola DSM] n=1 Tax=Mycobacterium shimoidei TaxID=29313 RepID=A0A1E3SXX6_MYCSH|nr:sugar porter family MFS transporter [Mycobacterium shimoidei]MCV7257074.1 sugar porter family MFS transporter [Mycobacterium shimoidei]ODR06981.1 MFS transporter [Mycobacterium shimoidei]ORW76871.1 MFS transporter [Mycobacterium shimoidei]SRX94981.1 sugar transporter [Tsukamurella paurometabola DSM] [Mycobacterium shimoidei]